MKGNSENKSYQSGSKINPKSKHTRSQFRLSLIFRPTDNWTMKSRAVKAKRNVVKSSRRVEDLKTWGLEEYKIGRFDKRVEGSTIAG